MLFSLQGVIDLIWHTELCLFKSSITWKNRQWISTKKAEANGWIYNFFSLFHDHQITDLQNVFLKKEYFTIKKACEDVSKQRKGTNKPNVVLNTIYIFATVTDRLI